MLIVGGFVELEGVVVGWERVKDFLVGEEEWDVCKIFLIRLGIMFVYVMLVLLELLFFGFFLFLLDNGKLGKMGGSSNFLYLIKEFERYLLFE